MDRRVVSVVAVVALLSWRLRETEPRPTRRLILRNNARSPVQHEASFAALSEEERISRLEEPSRSAPWALGHLGPTEGLHVTTPSRPWR
jgi:hypothetical protein